MLSAEQVRGLGVGDIVEMQTLLPTVTPEPLRWEVLGVAEDEVTFQVSYFGVSLAFMTAEITAKNTLVWIKAGE